MESMIEQCFSFNFTDITKYTVMPITNSPFMYQPLKFYSDEEKQKMKCDFDTECPDCDLFKKKQMHRLPIIQRM